MHIADNCLQSVRDTSAELFEPLASKGEPWQAGELES
jgi:hypothetical protein